MLLTLFLLLAVQGTRPAYVIDDGWDLRGGSTGYETMFFTRPGARPNMLWTRYEMKAPVRGYRSSRSLAEYDCASGRYRIVQETAFPRPNLEGQGTSLTDGPDWQYPAPQTFAETAYNLVCAGRR